MYACPVLSLKATLIFFLPQIQESRPALLILFGLPVHSPCYPYRDLTVEHLGGLDLAMWKELPGEERKEEGKKKKENKN